MALETIHKDQIRRTRSNDESRIGADKCGEDSIHLCLVSSINIVVAFSLKDQQIAIGLEIYNLFNILRQLI